MAAAVIPCDAIGACYTSRRKSLSAIQRHGMNILLLGSGGREQALAWKLAASPLVERLFCAAGIAGSVRDCKLVAPDIADHAAVIEFCKGQDNELLVLGTDAPLAARILDDLTP